EWRPRSFVPVAVAAAVAYVLRLVLMGYGPIFPITPHNELGGEVLMTAVIVGLVAGLASGALTALVYGFEDLFQKLPIHWMWWPVIGGLAVGVGGLLAPRGLVWGLKVFLA